MSAARGDEIAEHERHALAVGAQRREYVLYVPKRWRDAGPPSAAPVVFVFHGGGGTAQFAVAGLNWSREAEREGFLVVYPEGLRKDPSRPASFLRNPQFWSVAAGFGYSERLGSDDIRFVDLLLAELARRFMLDPARLYATGFSNGGSMAFRVGVELADRFTAIAPVAGHLWLKSTPPARPVPLIYFCGDVDPLCPLRGGEVKSPWGKLTRLPPVDESILTWARWLGCSLRPRVDDAAPGVTRARFAPGPGGARVDFYTVSGAGHVWPGGTSVMNERISGPATDRIDATAVIWEFFREFARV